ncbi:hypothetical protein FKP32DRAFT_536605 [Trametes sanguinea]|nr:hypothetical protein FKP32DRAFT_536605 [Trametes sanguinea]
MLHFISFSAALRVWQFGDCTWPTNYPTSPSSLGWHDCPYRFVTPQSSTPPCAASSSRSHHSTHRQCEAQQRRVCTLLLRSHHGV